MARDCKLNNAARTFGSRLIYLINFASLIKRKLLSFRCKPASMIFQVLQAEGSLMRNVQYSNLIAPGIALVLSVILTGCGKFSPSAAQFANIKPTSTSTLDPDDAYIQSQNLTDEGENVMDPDSFEQASDKFHQALEIDPTNFRAKFYLETMKPAQAIKGYFSRVRPFYMSLPNGESRYTNVVDNALGGISSSFRHFFLNGPEDIHSVSELQEYFDTVILSLENLRLFLRANKTQELRLRRIPIIFTTVSSDNRTETVQQCTDSKFGPLTVDLGFCGSKREVSLNRADFEVLQLAIAAYEGQLVIMNAYSINPKLVSMAYDEGELRDARIKSQRGSMGKDGMWVPPTNPQPTDLPKDEQNILTQKYLTALTDAGFGRLRKTQKISSFEDVAQGVKIALFYYMDNQRTLCKEGYATPRNRPGYLIETGLCQIPATQTGLDHPDPADAAARILEAALLGQPITPELMHHRSSKPWAINAMAVLRSPPENLSLIKAPDQSTCASADYGLDDSKFSQYMVRGTVTDMINEGDPRCEGGAR